MEAKFVGISQGQSNINDAVFTISHVARLQLCAPEGSALGYIREIIPGFH